MRERSVLRACQWCQFSMTRMHLKCEKLPRVVVAFQRGFCLEKTKHPNNIICESTKKRRSCGFGANACFTCWPLCGLRVVNYIVTEVNLLGRTHTFEEKVLGVSSVAYRFPSNSVSYSILFTHVRVSLLVALPQFFSSFANAFSWV